jgi:hypothetical protein
MYYTRYEDAVRANYTDATKVDIHLIDHPGSYNRILYNGRLIEYTGFGRMKSPGHPSAHQDSKKQDKFLDLYRQQGSVPIFHTESSGVIKFLGNYKIKSLRKKLSFEGFQYYEYIFARISINTYFLK